MQPREAIRQACLLLRGEQVSRPEIRPIVDRLSAIAKTSSGDLASMASGLDRDPVRLDAMAWLVDLADLCASGPRGVRGVGGEWTLVGTGDVAIDAEMHLLLAMKRLLQRPMAESAIYADEVREYLSSHDSGLVSFLLRRCVLNDNTVDDLKLDAIEEIRKRAVFPTLFLNGVLNWYGSRQTLSRKRKMADQLMQDHIIREGDRPAGWSSFLKNGAPRSAVGQDALARIAQADPWNAEVALAIGGPARSEDEVAARFPWRPGLINVDKDAAGGAPAKKQE
jgi:hypothetical protein